MINKYSCINIYENRKKNSKLSSQILYGEKFTIIKVFRVYLKNLMIFIPVLALIILFINFINKNQNKVKSNEFLDELEFLALTAGSIVKERFFS